MRNIIDTKIVSNVHELVDALKSMTVTDAEAIYLEGPNGEQGFALHLVENRLTDGSFVYNVIIRKALGGN